MKEIIGLLLLIVGAVIFNRLLKKCVHHFAFYGMSKTRIKKICKEQSIINKILLPYVFKYNNPSMTKWCFIWYHVFSVSTIIFIILAAIGIFVAPSSQPQAFFGWLTPLLYISFCLCFFSVIIKPVKKKK